MSIKDKLILIFLTIITLGIIWFFIWPKKTNKTNDKLSVSKKIPFNMNKLIEYIGNDNINSVSATHSKVKIGLIDSKKIQKDEIKKLNSVSGMFITSTSITLIVGNSAKLIEEHILNLLRK
ncbi:MAG: PTS glucose transporter subunit IIB [Mycoplasma sp.]|nr:PTS glucose transporter subunit IIB [Mycoplasma sp.]